VRGDFLGQPFRFRSDAHTTSIAATVFTDRRALLDWTAEGGCPPIHPNPAAAESVRGEGA
jgi:hypothetical protein